MKNAIHILLLSLSFLALFSTCKNPAIDYDSFTISEENITPAAHEVTVSGAFNFTGEVTGMKFILSCYEQLTNAVSHPMDIKGQDFSVIVKNLAAGTQYYYRYLVEFGPNLCKITDSIGSFTTLSATSGSEKPTVITEPVVENTQTTAICSGKIISEGSSPVKQYGFCWSTSPNPNINNNHTTNNSNENEFCDTLTNLSPNTHYFVCAYAINSEDIGYGEIIDFCTTNTNMFSITVSCNPTEGDVAGGGTYPEGSECTVKAIAKAHYDFKNWSENDSEVSTIADYPFIVDHDRSLVANFSKKQYHIEATAYPTEGGRIKGCEDYSYGDTCILHAIAKDGFIFDKWTENGIDIPNSQSGYEFIFIVNESRSLTAVFDEVPTLLGCINGVYSVSESKKVFFARGNLQYKASTSTWQLAPNQYDIIGNRNNNISETYNGWIDLFGWATSGYHNPSDPNNVNYHPWSHSSELSGYGPSNASGELTGNLANYDWGIYNQITTANGNSTGNMWRTLTKDEWNYVFNERHASTVNGIPDARFAKAYVNDIFGVILFPDDYTHPTGVEQPTGINEEPNWNENNYNIAEFELMQAAGAVFLPATGKRYGTDVNELNIGHYWSVTYNNMTTAFELRFNQNSLLVTTRNRCDGLSVRLVCPVW